MKRYMTGLATLAAAGILIYFWAAGPDSTELKEAPQAAPASPLLQKPPRAQANARQELPPVDQPIQLVLPALEFLAAAGDGRAACRIAAEHQRCAQLTTFEQEFDLWLVSRQQGLAVIEAARDSENLEVFRKSFEAELEQRETRLKRLRNHCENYNPPGAMAQIAAWRRAALLGDPVAIRQYASGSVFSRDKLVETAAAIPAYKAEAESMSLQLAQQGDLEMTLILAAAYSPLRSNSSPLLAQVVDPNPARALALYSRALGALGSQRGPEAYTRTRKINLQIDLLRQRMSVEDLAHSEAFGMELSAKWKPAKAGLAEGVNVFGEVSRSSPRDCGL